MPDIRGSGYFKKRAETQEYIKITGREGKVKGKIARAPRVGRLPGAEIL